MSDRIQRIGLLTGGGDCPGLNAVIRATVKIAIHEYGWEVLGIEDGFEGLIQAGKARLLDTTDVRGLLPRGGTIEDIGTRVVSQFNLQPIEFVSPKFQTETLPGWRHH